VEPGSLYAGVPAKRVKEVSPEQVENIIRKTANNYHLYSTWFKEEK
jgi:carbonic anhydrase/acetyltransferase-like protein (isoleucine patch superfamily)